MAALQFSVCGAIFSNCCVFSHEIQLFMIMNGAVIVWLVTTEALLGKPWSLHMYG